jgi:acyl carrier protein
MMTAQAMLTEQEIFEQLKPLLQEILGASPDEIQMNRVLVRDLGAESIDLLDLSFRIEEHFKVTIEANEIEREAKKRLPGGVYEKDGFLTEEALAEIRAAVPELEPHRLVKGLRKTDLPSLLNVAFFVRLVARKLAAQQEGVSHA